MAKGDQSSKSANGTGVPPKQDQYSVMHSIMDNIGGMAGSMAPSVMPGRDMKTSSDFVPAANGNIDFGGGNNSPLTNNFGGVTGGNVHPLGVPRMGTMYGVQAGGSGSMTPSNPQDMIRKTMMNKGSFGQSQ